MINAVFIHFYLDFALGVNLILPIQFYFVILHSKYKAFQTMDKQTLIDMFLANKGECFPAESIAHPFQTRLDGRGARLHDDQH